MSTEPTVGGVRLSVLAVLALLVLDLALLLARAFAIETNHVDSSDIVIAFGSSITATVAALTWAIHSGNGTK